MTQYRASALFIALLAFSGIAIKFYLNYQQGGAVLGALSHLFQFFTIWTNSLVFIVMLLIAIGRHIKQPVPLATASAILGVGIIFHALLSSSEPQFGLDLLGNLITHTFIPILTVLWWLVFQAQLKFQCKDALACIALPAIYCIYALLRAEFSGFYPYPFIDLPALGSARLITNVIGMGFAFYLFGLLLIACSKLIGSRLAKS